MKHRFTLYRLLFVASAFLAFASNCLLADDYLEVTKDFTQFNSKNFEGFLKPLFTTIEQSFNSNSYCRSVYQEKWAFGIDLSVLGTFIPDAQKSFDAVLPDSYGDYSKVVVSESRNGTIRTNFGLKTSQPTVYGGIATPVFANAINHDGKTVFMRNGVEYIVDDTALYKSIGFVEGQGISFMSGLPALQLALDMPWRSELRFRFIFAPVKNKLLSYLGFLYNQQFNHWFNWFKDDPLMGLAFNAAYHTLSRDPGISMQSWAFGVNFSKGWDNGLTLYSGLQYEDITGEIEVRKTALDPGETIESPYPEIRFAEPIKINVETFTNFRFTGGISYRYSIFELHGDFAIASQPSLNAGVTFWLSSSETESEKATRLKRQRSGRK